MGVFFSRAAPAGGQVPRVCGQQRKLFPMADKSAVRSRAEAAFSASEQRDALVKEEIARERAATDAKTIRLKALRLAKEAEEAGEKAKNPPAPVKKKAKTKRVSVS
jgi:hypothetical protein